MEYMLSGMDPLTEKEFKKLKKAGILVSGADPLSVFAAIKNARTRG